MSIGRMDREITLQKRSTQTSGISNEKKDQWIDVATVWGEYLPSRGYAREQGEQIIDIGEDVFRIWYRSDVTSDMRILHNNETKQIVSIEEFGRRHKLIIRTQRLQ